MTRAREYLEDRARDLHAPFNRLVRIRVGAEGDGLAHVGRPGELRFQHLAGVSLVEKPGLEVEAGREPHVGVTRTGVAVMTHHAFGDEITRLRRNVEEPHGLQRLNARDLQASAALECPAFDVEFTRDRWVGGVKEPQVLLESARHSHAIDRLPVFELLMLNSEIEMKSTQARAYPLDDLRVGV